jgi:hypothetical protein
MNDYTLNDFLVDFLREGERLTYVGPWVDTVVKRKPRKQRKIWEISLEYRIQENANRKKYEKYLENLTLSNDALERFHYLRRSAAKEAFVEEANSGSGSSDSDSNSDS